MQKVSQKAVRYYIKHENGIKHPGKSGHDLIQTIINKLDPITAIKHFEKIKDTMEHNKPPRKKPGPKPGSKKRDPIPSKAIDKRKRREYLQARHLAIRGENYTDGTNEEKYDRLLEALEKEIEKSDDEADAPDPF